MPSKFKHLGLSTLSLIPLTVIPHQAVAMLSIVVSGTVDMNFGTMTVGAVGGTIEVNNAGARSVTGDVTPIVGGSVPSNGAFSVAGSTGLAMDVSVTAASFDVTNGTTVMSVDNFQLLSDVGGTAGTITLAANPSSYTLGATLNVGAGQAEGTYTGEYTISVNYQ